MRYVRKNVREHVDEGEFEVHSEVGVLTEGESADGVNLRSGNAITEVWIETWWSCFFYQRPRCSEAAIVVVYIVNHLVEDVPPQSVDEDD